MFYSDIYSDYFLSLSLSILCLCVFNCGRLQRKSSLGQIFEPKSVFSLRDLTYFVFVVASQLFSFKAHKCTFYFYVIYDATLWWTQHCVGSAKLSVPFYCESVVWINTSWGESGRFHNNNNNNNTNEDISRLFLSVWIFGTVAEDSSERIYSFQPPHLDSSLSHNNEGSKFWGFIVTTHLKLD